MASSNPKHDLPAEDDFVVASRPMQALMRMVERVSPSLGTVLIVGETGTGKERIARAVHELSDRSRQPFIDVNCAALPEHLVESELFGYEKGAFSGADTTKPGLFEMAHLGTLFLDEIGELDQRVQVKLLRVLDRAPFYRLGGSRKVVVDVRVVAATNRDLREEIKAGRFRKDLYHRLSQFELLVPPLRDRPEDIEALANQLLLRNESALAISADAMRALIAYKWPGNVRELQNTINKIIFDATGTVIEEIDVHRTLHERETLGEPTRPLVAEVVPQVAASSQLSVVFDRLPLHLIREALQKTNGHRGQAAVELGISRRTLSRKLRELGLTAARLPQDPESLMAEPGERDRQSFRAPLRVPATLVLGVGNKIQCTTTNLSIDGLGLAGVGDLLDLPARVRFQVPGAHALLDLSVRLAWNDKNGSVGVIFNDIDQESRRCLRIWLDKKMIEYGWPAISCTAKATPVVSSSKSYLQ